TVLFTIDNIITNTSNHTLSLTTLFRSESWDSLEKAIVMYTSVAAWIVALRDRAQQEPNAPATVLLSEDECAVLVAKFGQGRAVLDRKSTRLNSSHLVISYAVFCLKKKK